jgi:hypothetical protein
VASSRRGFAIVTCILGTVTLAIGIGVASGAKLKTKSKSATAAAGGGVAAPTAKCKRGTKAVSGGFESGFALTKANVIFPFESRGLGRSWTTAGVNGGTAAGTLTSFAYCRDARLKDKSKSIDIAGAVPGEIEPGTVKAKCPKGTKAFSGGFQGEFSGLSLPASFVIAYASRKLGKRRWSVSGAGIGDVPAELTAHVKCGKGPALATRQATDEVGNGIIADTEEIVARCKRSQRVVSGGFASSVPLGAAGLFYASRKQGKRNWLVEVEAGPSLEDVDVTAYAYCEKKKAN